METAIRKALQAGWQPKKHREVWEYNPNNRTGVRKTVRASLTHNDILLDPLFWQALGKSLGWTDNLWIGKMSRLVGDKLEVHDWELRYWEYEWHRFIDALIEGKSADEFFKNLLK